MNNDNYLSVSEINKIIKGIFDNEEFLRKVYIKGEVSNITYHTRGHLYFSLKDENSVISAVMFNYSKNLSFNPKDGDSVLVRGRISVYESSGKYQIYVEEMLEDGVGDLYVLYEKLKNQLLKEGLFDKDKKKKIPRMPKKIGVITASTGAAVRDIITTINRRFPMVTLYLFPSLVQGDGAKEDIVNNLKLASTFDLDVIILGRGGGSIEDLWAFNEEVVARAIYNSEIPIISAVGHEIDFTISDFVADLRAPTPTAAAELVVPDKNEIFRYLSDALQRLNNSLYNKLDALKERLGRYSESYILKNPVILYEKKSQELDILIERLENNFSNIITQSNHRLKTLELKLDLLNPVNILEKGYSIVKKDDKIIKSGSDVKLKDTLNIILKDANIKTIVKEVN